MHGVSEEDYQREIAKAREEGNNDRINALQVARDVIDALEFRDLNSSMDLIEALQFGMKRAYILMNDIPRKHSVSLDDPRGI